ncbi:hypothetical protein KMW28_09715 [Flammeovirga yaeyamensis]|uniref:Uncharacterized protein n=1 Tax=Flammeovirga yaeyamensis TaxID=367791 RepID=A0AAX1N9L8_9BACT|nr:hypothetical protein [Flammeovirga yaeyamensis]MBB3698768.1 hypothetical protein [Flammeovirga yaeyamensis]NMF37353.1 hypothetical protein [Flammeovirga yaeyamensis]QWG03831.1 hypothetical protein KMW28_09715 [Flammeovirga yaeyamensis]
MDTTAIDKALIAIVEKRQQLNALTYEDESYDDIEDELHDLEDDFIDEHGETLEDIIGDVHEEYKVDTEVLSPLSYIAQEYVETGANDLGKQFDCNHAQGVPVEVDELENKPTRLVIIPNPLRIILNVDAKNRKIVWQNA